MNEYENVKLINGINRYHFLTNGVVKIWKSLSEEIVNSKSKNIFKA